MSSSICCKVESLRPAFSSSITALRDRTTLERLRLSLITLASISWLRRLSRLRIGRTSTCEPGRKAAIPSISTRKPPLIRSLTRPFTFDVRPIRNLDSLRNQEIEAKVIKLNRKRSNVVLSRKAVIEEENAGRKDSTLQHIEEDIVVEGQIKNLTEYGAFVDLGGVD